MPVHIAFIVLLSAVLHASWNALLKDHDDKEALWWAFGAVLCVWAFVHAVVAGHDLLAIAEVWPLIAASLIGQLCYGSGLIGAYRRGDLSAYYPIIRSSPVVIVIIGVLFLGSTYEWATLAGIALVVVGAFLLQFRPGIRILDNPIALAFALLGLLGTGIYTMADAHAVRQVPPPVVFFWIELLLLPLYMVVFRIYGHGAVERRGIALLLRNPSKVVLVGLLGYASYYLVLWAFSAGGEVAGVAAIRQASIPVSVVLGGMWLGEAHFKLRLAASLMLAAGIAVIILGG